MARRAVALRPDVVHTFKPIGYSGMVGFLLSRFSAIPQVVDADDWEGTGGWADVHAYPRHLRALVDWQERWLPRHASAVTVASRTLQERIQALGVPSSRLLYLPNGPDPSLRNKANVSAEARAAVRKELGVGDAPLAIYLGQIPRGTDLDLALEAMVGVCKELADARLVVAGVGDGLAGLKELARELGLGDRAVFPGWVEPERAHIYLAAADAVVNPYRDTLINRAKCAGKVVAAMAMAKPIVTSRLGENVNYIEHGRSGLLTEPGDTGALSRALVAVLEDRRMAEALGKQARRRIWERYDWEVQAGAVEQIYGLAQSGPAS
jgi:glycosyltransferase involved in cell wall biosynthesis